VECEFTSQKAYYYFDFVVLQAVGQRHDKNVGHGVTGQDRIEMTFVLLRPLLKGANSVSNIEASPTPFASITSLLVKHTHRTSDCRTAVRTNLEGSTFVVQ
jgi:hypothetical protein